MRAASYRAHNFFVGRRDGTVRGRCRNGAKPRTDEPCTFACSPLGSGNGIVAAQPSALIGAETGFAIAT